MIDVLSLGKLSMRNKEALKKSRKCSCYYCGKTYSPKQIKEYCDKGQTAICPKCGIDSVIGDSQGKITKELLEAGYDHWFNDFDKDTYFED